MNYGIHAEYKCYKPVKVQIENTNWNEGIRGRILISSSFISGSQITLPKVKRSNYTNY